VWSVPYLDQAIEQFVERMGFPLLYGPSEGEPAMRAADIGLGSAWIRLVEYPHSPSSQPIARAHFRKCSTRFHLAISRRHWRISAFAR